jgi:hypothetical protein
MTKIQATFLALVAAQTAHSVEEYLGRVYEVFAPAHFVSRLISRDPRLGFLVFNLALIGFGLWCFIWPIRRRWPSAIGLMGFWVALELVNGIGHSLWTLIERRYTPGMGTAPVLLALSVYLAWQLRNSQRRADLIRP